VLVTFTNSSTNANSYQWNFGDPASGASNTSTANNPAHTYGSAALYTVELIACNTACLPERCDTDLFTVNVVDSGRLTASFIVTPATGCIEDTIKFKNTSGNATTYFWNFGDQNTSTLKSPFHIYTLPGTYTVTLISGNGTISDTTTRTITVNSPPAAVITATGSVTFCNGDSVTLSASGGTVYHWSNGHVGATLKVKTSGTFTVTATNSCGSNTSTPITVTVNTPVDTIVASGDTLVCSGDSVELVSNIIAGATYQWRLNGNIIVGAIHSTYYAKATGNYKSNVIVNQCEGVSNIIHIVVNPSPTATITTSAGTVICTGDSVKLVETLTAGAAYQWQNNGANITGATTHIYYVKIAGTYTCVVTNNGCSSTSNSIIVTTNTTPPAIITPAGTVATCNGDTVDLSAPTGNGYTYQWFKGGVAIAGATSPFYNTDSAGTYKVSVSANGCSAKSAGTIIKVNPVPTASAGSPQSITGCSFTTVTIGGNPTASGGTTPYLYQWSPSSGLNDSVIANPTVSQIGTTTNYNVVVTDSNGCTAESSVLITVNGSSLSVTTSFTGDTSWCFGSGNPVNLTATPVGGASPYIYNWTPATDLSSTNSATTTATPTAVGVYNYTVLVIDHNGCQASGSVPVTIYAVPVASIIALDTTSPCGGDSVNFTSTPGAGYAYQWLNSGTAIAGANSINYTTAAAGSYSVSVTAGICSATSGSEVVTNRANPLAQVISHGGSVICVGGSQQLIAATANGYTYQWYLNGFGIGGATSSIYTAQDSGAYFAVVTLNGCSLASDTVSLTEVAYPDDSISIYGQTTFCNGDSLMLGVSTGPGYLYQWQNNGNNIQGADDSTVVVYTSGNYNALVTYSGCASTSGEVSVTVYLYPSATLTNVGNLTFCGGDSVTLSATDSAQYNYQWVLNVGGNVDTLPNVTPSITVGDSGLYNVIISQNVCSTASNALYANEIALPVAGAFLSGDGFVCPGTTDTISANVVTGYTYQWQLDGNNLTGATNPTYVATDSGTYTVVETGVNNCPAVSNYAVVSYDSCTVGIETIVKNESISIYPNPAHNSAIISVDCNQAGNISIKMFDVTGRQVSVVFEGKTVAGSNIYTIPLDGLSEGMYMVRLYDGSSVVTRKLVKE
jgi:PKD repeat protein